MSGDIVDEFGVTLPAPGNGRAKRARIDAEGNAVFTDVWVRPNGVYPRYNLTEASGASVSVKAYGAVGDGVTDDSAAFQAAFDSGASVISNHQLQSLLHRTGLLQYKGLFA